MSDSIKNNEYLHELIRYKNNKMTNQERHQFERALERDPFLAEALEGFDDFKTSDIEKDLASINLLTGKSKNRISPRVYISAAASIAILIVTFLLVKNFDNKDQIAKVEQQQEEYLVPLVDSLFSQGIVDSIANEPTDSSEYEIETPVVDKQNVDRETVKNTDRELLAARTIAKERSTSGATSQKNDSSKNVEKKPSILAAVKIEETTEDIAPVRVAAMMDEELRIDDEQLAKSATPSTELTEEIINTTPEVSLRPGANASPAPLGGFDLFKEYLEQNLNYPASQEKATREVVRLIFTVAANGELKNISIDKAPENDDFGKEAIRVLRNGPKWSPAIKDGLPIEEVVNYRVVFKP